MKKVLIITLEYPPQIGGIATYVHQMAKNLESKNVVVYAPLSKDSKLWDDGISYKVIRKKALFPRLLWPRWVRMLFQVWRIVKKEKIEIILINHVLPVGYVGFIIHKLLKIPYIIFSHGTDVLMATRSSWKIKMLRTVINNSEQIIFNSESLQSRFLQVLPEFENKSIVMYPCPDEDLLIPPPQEEIRRLRATLALEGKKVILSVSRIDEGKGFPHLVRTLPQVLKREPHAVWVIIGDGPKREEVMRDIQKHRLQNVVRYIGLVPQDQLKLYYYIADIFALFTHSDNGKEEGLGMVFLEAAAAGLPVVAGKSGGVEEAVIHTQTGIIVDVHQQALAMDDAIVTLLSNKSYAEKLGRNGKERIQSEFIWNSQLKILGKWIM